MKRWCYRVLATLATLWVIVVVTQLSRHISFRYCKSYNADLMTQDQVIPFQDIQRQNEVLDRISRIMRNIEKTLDRQPDDQRRWSREVEPLRKAVSGLFVANESLKYPTSAALRTDVNGQHNEVTFLEYSLRSAHNQIEQTWHFLNSQMQKREQASSLLEKLRVRKNAVLVELEVSQSLLKEKSLSQLKAMKDEINEKIRFLQEPQNCTASKKLLCGLGEKCGFACQLHHVAVCFALAIGSGRTLILDSSEWAYSRNPWEAVFKPVSSRSCVGNPEEAVVWEGKMSEADVEHVQAVRVNKFEWKTTPSQFPLRIPKYFARSLMQHHGDPCAWWMGQLVSYLIRPQPWLALKIAEAERRVDFQTPIAGIHVRRTDKLRSEASFYDLSEYMMHVSDWFEKEALKRQRTGEPPIERKRVYVASDDPSVLDDAKKKYPKYDFFGDKRISMIANAGGRYSLTGVIGLMTDVTLLSKCNFFVGTFSSGMSRLVYEMMQVHHVDPTASVRSLDDLYYYVGQFDREQRAVYQHFPVNTNEIAMEIGDVIATKGDHWDGFSLGTNMRTGQQGLYPSYKAEGIIATANFNMA